MPSFGGAYQFTRTEVAKMLRDKYGIGPEPRPPYDIGGTDIATDGVNPDRHIPDGTIAAAKIVDLEVEKLLAGSLSVGQYIQSPDYVAGTSGWRISDADCEFNSGTFRGVLSAATVRVKNSSTIPTAAERIGFLNASDVEKLAIWYDNAAPAGEMASINCDLFLCAGAALNGSSNPYGMDTTPRYGLLYGLYNSASRWRVFDGRMTNTGSSQSVPVVAGGSVSVTVSGTPGAGSATVTFPTGMVSAPDSVSAIAASNTGALYVCAVSSVVAGSMSISVRRMDNAADSGTKTVYWTAVWL